MRIVLLYILLCFAFVARGQNLVQNPSFEQYNQCPNDQIGCDIASIPFWQWSKSGAAYANLCNFSDTAAVFCAAPHNVAADGCYQYPQDGNGYALVDVIAANGTLAYRNHLQSKLVKPLDSAKCYYFSMYINLCDSCGFATDDIGVLFVNNFINVNGPNLVENFPTPQIMNLGDFITNKENWVKYEDTFTATGGENYILIGSMSIPDSISQISLPTGNDWNHKATYWIDNITLIECDQVGINEEPKPQIKVYPNPSNGVFTIENTKPIKHLKIYNSYGQLVYAESPSSTKTTVDLTHLPAGMYLCNIDNSIIKLIKE